MTSPLSALGMFLSSQPYDLKRTNAGDEGAVVDVTSVTPAPIKRVTLKSKQDQRCNPCNPCNPRNQRKMMFVNKSGTKRAQERSPSSLSGGPQSRV